MNSIQKLLEIMADLRNKDKGCPWDLEQDFASVAPYTVEEAYEVADAIARDDLDGLRAELGDLLFQVVFHARMAEEKGAFDFDDVAAQLHSPLNTVDEFAMDEPGCFVAICRAEVFAEIVECLEGEQAKRQRR